MKNLLRLINPIHLLVLFLLLGCDKTEFLPPPVGEVLPYKEPEKLETAFQSLMKGNHKVYQKIIEKSKYESFFKESTPYTFLIPSDDALRKYGITEASVSSMTKASADSLIEFLTVKEIVAKEGLEVMFGNFRTTSLTLIPIRYYQYLGIENDAFLWNGMPVGKANEGYEVSNGYVWPIETIIKREKGDMESVMLSDPRFSMFYEIKTKSDSIYWLEYEKLYKANNNGYAPTATSSPRVLYNLMGFKMARFSSNSKTFFLPTNDAFKKAGFNSTEEVLEWNKRGGKMKYDIKKYPYYLDGEFPMDTILAYHVNWGRDVLPYTTLFGRSTNPITSIFYINDLNNEFLWNFPLNNNPNYKFYYVMPFDFSKDNEGRVQLKIKGSNYPSSTITETIHTALGPIYVVDRLLIPKDYKMK